MWWVLTSAGVTTGDILFVAQRLGQIVSWVLISAGVNTTDILFVLLSDWNRSCGGY